MTPLREDSPVASTVNLVVPIKPLTLAKSRLAGGIDPQGAIRHTDLVLAMAMDTVAAAVAAPGVARVLVVATDPAEVTALRDLGAEIIADDAAAGLNTALRHGAGVLRAADPHAVVGALQADLPALAPGDLAAAIADAGGERAFCADRHGTGTTLLLSAAAGELDPRFGPFSAGAHATSGATALAARLTTLRADVDTPGDLRHVRAVGLGRYTSAVLSGRRLAC